MVDTVELLHVFCFVTHEKTRLMRKAENGHSLGLKTSVVSIVSVLRRATSRNKQRRDGCGIEHTTRGEHNGKSTSHVAGETCRKRRSGVARPEHDRGRLQCVAPPPENVDTPEQRWRSQTPGLHMSRPFAVHGFHVLCLYTRTVVVQVASTILAWTRVFEVAVVLWSCTIHGESCFDLIDRLAYYNSRVGLNEEH